MDSFAALFEASVAGEAFGKEGEIVKGTVVAVQRDNVIIDIGGKSEGMIALNEFSGTGGEVSVTESPCARHGDTAVAMGRRCRACLRREAASTDRGGARERAARRRPGRLRQSRRPGARR